MLNSNVIRLAVLAVIVVWEPVTHAATGSKFKLCGRKLSEIMSRVCHAYNSPTWDDPRVLEQPVVRRKRQAGIADECCTYGCSWEQLTEYCAISSNSESSFDALEAHMIADRSAEQESLPPAVISGVVFPAHPSTEPALGRREELLKNVERAAPVVGTVSPLLTWARTLNTYLLTMNRDQYAYVALNT